MFFHIKIFVPYMMILYDVRITKLAKSKLYQKQFNGCPFIFVTEQKAA